MPDNLAVTPGAGATMRADDVGGILHQMVKISLGADGVEDLMLDSGQQLAAASLPVVVASDVPAPVGWIHTFVSITVAATAITYDAGDCVGTNQTLANAVRTTSGSAVWNSLLIRDTSNVKPALGIVLFDASPGGTYTNGSAMSLTTDNAKVVAALHVPSSAYLTIGGIAYAFVNIAQGVSANGSTSLFTASMVIGAPTLTANCLTYRFGFLQS